MTLTVGSLCSGYEGLGLGLSMVVDTEPTWVSEVEPAACRVLEARFPGVPNIGDLTVADWSGVPPVDVLTAGYPCQPFSHAGQRQGADDERHLWPYIRDAVRLLRPRVVVLENVAGHLSLGFDVVLGDLAALGLTAEWTVVRASDVGAAHRRARLFVVASQSLGGRRRGWGEGESAAPWDWNETGIGGAARTSAHVAADAGGAGAWLPATPGADGDRGGAVPRQSALVRLGHGAPVAEGTHASGGAPAAAAGPRRTGSEDGGTGRGDAGQDGRRGAEPQRGGAAAADAACLCQREPTDQAHPLAGGRQARTVVGSRGVRTPADWGAYGPAIARHAAVLGRPAPDPVDGRGRLSPLFVEWLMLLPEGWVTDIVTKRSAALKMLGNGVVPLQAAYALRGLFARLAELERVEVPA